MPNNKSNLPHRVRYDSPKDGRNEKAFVINDRDQERLAVLEALATTTFDESIYKLDVYLAALRSGLNDDKAFLEEMRKIGYGYFD
ncbi:hypothetical protein [Natronorubrum sp. FCH18a]|uniref:hypothetical protein n=1 Tax=Natronorubrum sp. FCH18a TaxID=3447018 RepID=UPI003F516528